MTELTIPLPPDVFWPMAYLFTFALACGLAYALMAAHKGGTPDPLDRIKERLGAEDWPDAAVLAGLALWGALFVLLFLGLVLLIWEVLKAPHPAADDSWSFRFALIRIAGLTATLGAVVALPFTMARLRLTQKQAATAAEALFNDKINAASADLHAMRQRWDPELKENIWEDDITRRNAAIDRLGGLVREEPEVAGRVSRLLSVYVRELSREVPVQIPPENLLGDQIRYWANELSVQRSDMENATQVLGSLQLTKGVNSADVTIDLRAANLQGFNLSNGMFSGANFTQSNLQGAKFTASTIEESDFTFCGIQGADFGHAKLHQVKFKVAQMQTSSFREATIIHSSFSASMLDYAEFRESKANDTDFNSSFLRNANINLASFQNCSFVLSQLQGAELRKSSINWSLFKGVNFDENTDTEFADFSGSAFGSTVLHRDRLPVGHLRSVFGDASVAVVDEYGKTIMDRPTHWPAHRLGIDYWSEWKKWCDDPDIYKPPVKDITQSVEAAE